MNIEELTAKQMRESQTISITGVVIENKLKGVVIIIPCLCVQDSPDNPCPCTDLSKILISKNNIVGDIVPIDKKSIDGESLSLVTIDRNATVLVEHTASVNAENAIAVTHKLSLPKPTFPFPFPTSTGPTFPYPDPKDPEDPEVMYFLGSVIGGLVKKYGPTVAAGVVGAIGGWLTSDDKTCTKETTSATTTNADGSITRTTNIVETCK
ncbi:hypothetical protein FEI13_18140 [Halomonas urmiana]|uniref:Uncharacterized protein n=1 Tax=Halomonas urmiana TaxID=490901 RepID=A0A5R8M7I3_9GAMM|nr:hypothetical protein [Halomonas urmiana]TLF45440.1 hypothetical protein FEI13_18140 [Halomonas urmiana]